MKTSCKDCDERTINCHSTCEKYKQYIAERQRIKEIRQQYLDSFAPLVTAPQGKSRTLKKIKCRRFVAERTNQ